MYDETENELSIFFTTSYYPTKYFQDKRHSKMLPIHTSTKWNYTTVSIFLNELHDFVKKDHCITEIDGKTVFNFQSSIDSNHQISILISNDGLSVEASYYWLVDCWKSHSLEMASTFGSRGRELKNRQYSLLYNSEQLFE